MELKLSPRRLLVMVTTLAVALAVVLAMTLSSATASAAVKHGKHHARHHAALVADPTGNAQAGGNDTTSADNEAPAPEGANIAADPDGPGGPDVGGDHQCPPACSAGETG